MCKRNYPEYDIHRPGARLTGLFSRTLAWYALAVATLWMLGIESIHGSPTPFYALLYPAFDWTFPWWHIPPLAVFLVFLALLRATLARLDWFEAQPPGKTAFRLAISLALFLFAFAAVIAMVREGPAGISHAYARQTYEYIGDIGKTRGIRALFHDYLKIHPHLSMHAKVHPPGPIALLWLLSYVVFSQDPMPLSLATMAVSILGVIPLYLWVSDMAGRRVALTSCLIYVLMPSVVLFTATSADILFTPFTLSTLFLFWRALHRRSAGYALAAGACYGLVSLLSFSLLGLGAFFAIVGLWRLFDSKHRLGVIQTAAIMAASFLAVHVAVRLWSGYDAVACLQVCKAQFDLDQANLDLLTPRYPAWTYKFFNPACWFYYAGIPASVLFAWRLARPDAETKGLFLVFALTLLAFNFLYIARGESERSALYVFPFIAIPAAHLLDSLGRQARSPGPLTATVAFLAFQCWLTESILYTFW